ncbi:helix-turn-helix domain-containing protein [Candidatus Bathyarchaeota archaeon]|nr:helix-turn-helix domain-containing protein [Candidatus Bathyarchaeota archaeon]
MAGQGDTRYKALDHPIRREIIQFLASEPQTYSRLLEKLGIESGHLTYHLRTLEELVEKDIEGKYQLNREGEQAYRFLTGETKPTETSQSLYIYGILLAVAFLLVVILGSALLGAYTENNEQHITELREDTSILTLEVLDIVYEIFQDWEIPREHWTELLLKIIQIRSNLEKKYDLTGEESINEYADHLRTYESLLSDVIIVGDPGYLSLTIEKRYLIRELHSILLEIDEKLTVL